MFSSSLDTLLMVSKTTSPQKLFAYIFIEELPLLIINTFLKYLISQWVWKHWSLCSSRVHRLALPHFALCVVLVYQCTIIVLLVPFGGLKHLWTYAVLEIQPLLHITSPWPWIVVGSHTLWDSSHIKLQKVDHFKSLITFCITSQN